MNKMKKQLIQLILICFVITNVFSQNKKIISEYLEQPEPKDTPEIFAPGLISIEGANEYPCSFSHDFSFMLFGYNWGGGKKNIMIVNRADNGNWTEPKKISFTGFPEAEAILSSNDSMIFFAAHTDSTKYKAHDIWYVNRVSDGWSNPIKLNENINTDEYEYFATITNSNKLYFSREGQILTTNFVDNSFKNVQPIDSIISKMRFISHPYVSPDEKFIIFDSREPGGYGSADLYISFRKNDKWGKPINLGEKINTSQWDAMPIVSPDGKYLFFCRKSKQERDIYWVQFDINDYN